MIMAVFPKREAEILALAQNMATGLVTAAADFPAPPVSAADLAALLGSAHEAADDAVATRAQAEQVTAVKEAAMDELIGAMRADLRYAEDAVNFDDAKLSALGWGGKKSKTPLSPPGQARSLEAPRQGEGWVFLDWKAPAEGGTVAAYRIERRERPAGDWALVEMATDSEATLLNQERAKDLEYRVIATNKAGAGDPSNTTAVVL